MSYLRVYIGDTLQNQLELNVDRLTIGRARDNDLILNDPGISAHHAVIVREGTRYFIEDNASTNGVFLNNERIERAELKYWDEIQIYNHILRFMALSGLKDGADPDIPVSTAKEMDKTLVMGESVKQQLSELRSRKKSALVSVRNPDGSETHHPFGHVEFKIGHAADCDLITGGWLAPKLAATLEKSSDGYYLTPHGRGRVVLNDEPIKIRSKLKDGDHFKVRNLDLEFVHRVIEE